MHFMLWLLSSDECQPGPWLPVLYHQVHSQQPANTKLVWRDNSENKDHRELPWAMTPAHNSQLVCYLKIKTCLPAHQAGQHIFFILVKESRNISRKYLWNYYRYTVIYWHCDHFCISFAVYFYLLRKQFDHPLSFLIHCWFWPSHVCQFCILRLKVDWILDSICFCQCLCFQYDF